MSRPSVTRLSGHVFFVQAGAVNWTLLTEGDEVTLVDAGYPGDLGALLHSLEEIGRRPEQVTTVLVTHAHVDHIGAVPGLLRLAPRARVMASPEEVPHVRRDHLQQARPLDIAANLWRPGFPGWTLHILRAGALKDPRVPGVLPFPARSRPGEALDVPGRPVPLLTPGHTSGHTCYHLPGSGALITGDALVTAHPTSRAHGPQLLRGFFHHDRAAASACLDLLAPLDADVLLPGHGPVHHGKIADAVTAARAATV